MPASPTPTHTPGPWNVSAYEGGWTCVREESMGAIIAKLGLNNDANAHLIAAAPAMKAALEDIAERQDPESFVCAGIGRAALAAATPKKEG